MTVKHAKSAQLTVLDTVIPPNTNTAGEGGPANLKTVDASLVVPAAAAVDSTLRFVRVPSNCKVKQIRFTTQAQAAGSIDFGVYYPILGLTGKPDLAANAISQAFFASAVAVTSASNWTDITNESGTYTADLAEDPLWLALGLASDPGGYFDIVGTVVSADVTTGLGIAGLSVSYAN